MLEKNRGKQEQRDGESQLKNTNGNGKSNDRTKQQEEGARGQERLSLSPKT